MSPKPIITTLPQNDSTITKSRPQSPDISDDLYELYKNAPDNYLLRQSFEPEIEKEPQKSTNSQPQETQPEHLNQQSFSTKETDKETTSELTKTFFCASPGKQPLLENDVFIPLTTDEGINIMYLNLSTNLTLQKETSHVLFPHGLIHSLIQAPSPAPSLKQISTKLNFYQMKQSKALTQHQNSNLWWQMVNLNAPLEPSSSNSR